MRSVLMIVSLAVLLLTGERQNNTEKNTESESMTCTVIQLANKSMFHPLLYSYTPLAISSAEPTRPNITRHQFFSSALTGVVAIGVNKSNTIWCSARNRVMGSGKLQNLFWLYSNRTRLPAVGRGQSSDHDVYMERYVGSSDQDNAVWRRVLHFKTTKPSSAGNYTCATNYEKNTNYQTVKIQVSGE